MPVTIYFVNAGDTPVTTPDPGFIEGLKSAAATHREVRVVERADAADLILLDEQYQYRTWRYRDNLAECRFVRENANRIYVINHDDYARVFLPGLYAALDTSVPPLVDAASAPYKRDLWRIPVPETFAFDADRLYAFRGTFHTHRVREKMCRQLSTSGAGICEELRKAFHNHDEEDQQRYIREIRRAKFSLCPRGLSPSSYRLYESMQLGRCPVVVSDHWLPPRGVDWDSFLIRVPETRLDTLEASLRQREPDAEGLGRLAYDAWYQYFSWPARYRTFLNLALQLHAGRVSRPDFGELRDIWHSQAMHQLYGWTLRGRIWQRLRNLAWRMLDKPAPT